MIRHNLYCPDVVNYISEKASSQDEQGMGLRGILEQILKEGWMQGWAEKKKKRLWNRG